MLPPSPVSQVRYIQTIRRTPIFLPNWGRGECVLRVQKIWYSQVLTAKPAPFCAPGLHGHSLPDFSSILPVLPRLAWCRSVVRGEEEVLGQMTRVRKQGRHQMTTAGGSRGGRYRYLQSQWEEKISFYCSDNFKSML